MKMKEVESLTGVTREAIRFYIRKGLLPAPEKPKNNVAFYTNVDVERIGSIKKLQDEKLLPLDVIRDVIDQGGELLFSMQDSAIVKKWAEIKRNGFSYAFDYFVHDLKLYHGACQQQSQGR
jgi:DNA-binding transcriptional MerR regulator